jgi:transposase-like protein
VSIVARRHDVNANQLFKWRRQHGGLAPDPEPVRLLPVEIAASPAGPNATVPAPRGAALATREGGSLDCRMGIR